jgi:trk system potassium uptake protein TrkA
MKIIVIGAGFTGSLLAKALVAEGNNVVLIDDDAERVRSAGDQLDCTVIEADGKNLSSLEKAGLEGADALVTLTGDDEVNMITCALVDAVYPNIVKIARVRNYDHYIRTMEVSRRSSDRSGGSSGRPIFGIDYIINPDVEAAGSIMHAMEIGAAGSFIEIGGEYTIAVLSVQDSCRLSGRKLKDTATLEGWNYLIAFVESEGNTVMPHGETVIKPGDHVGILARKDDLSKVLEFTGSVSTPIDRVVIFGADNVSALTVASQMEENQSFWYSLLGLGRSKGRRLTVIDRDLERCRNLSEKFPSARILKGDITDDGLLQDENICDCDLMIAASGNYERNLMTSAYMKLRGVRRVIALTSDSAFDEIADKLGVDVTIPMRDIVIDTIISRLRGNNVKSVHSIGARKFEIITCEISDRSRVAGRRIKDVSGLDGSLILLVKNPADADWAIPNGNTVIENGAQAVFIATSGDTAKIRMFAGKPEMSS